ncbi:hypothetical protein VT85_09975 [Planctomyces sp. SH-PL62]|nr:hypothetical protein VT85_09975 [Planctomyces sp. SH-PL62]
MLLRVRKFVKGNLALDEPPAAVRLNENFIEPDIESTRRPGY